MILTVNVITLTIRIPSPFTVRILFEYLHRWLCLYYIFRHLHGLSYLSWNQICHKSIGEITKGQTLSRLLLRASLIRVQCLLGQFCPNIQVKCSATFTAENHNPQGKMKHLCQRYWRIEEQPMHNNLILVHFLYDEILFKYLQLVWYAEMHFCSVKNMTTQKASLIKQISFMFSDEIYKEIINVFSSAAIIISNASLNIVPLHLFNSCLSLVSRRYFFTSKQANKCEPSNRHGQ